MNVLAFDCCFGAASAAVRWRKGQEWLLHESYELHAGGNAERLFPMIAEALDGAGLELAEIDRIAVTLGPGTFTGVRVGVAAARAFALAMRKPVVGTTSLAVMAHRARQQLDGECRSGPLSIAVDARRGMVYLQLFQAGGVQITDALLLDPSEAARMIATQTAGGGSIPVVGSGASAVAEALHVTGREASAHLPELQPHAGALVLMASELVPLGRVGPIYLRQPDVKLQTAPSLRADQP